MNKVGMLVHPRIEVAQSLAQELKEIISRNGASVWQCSAWEEEEARSQVPGTDLIVSLGGDGTILRAARAVIPWCTPILGVNLGRLGFMAEIGPSEARERLPSMLKGESWVEERTMLRAELIPSGSVEGPGTFHALNDVVVGRGRAPRLVPVRATVDGEFLTCYRADGVIVATATGSTAYSLSAGGPVLYPQAKEMLLQPIAAHLSLAAALVLPPTATVELEVEGEHQAVLSIDGQVDVALNGGDRVRVSRSPHRAQFLRTEPPTFFYRALGQRLSGTHAR
jgi:NAD+ kinase